MDLAFHRDAPDRRGGLGDERAEPHEADAPDVGDVTLRRRRREFRLGEERHAGANTE